MTVRKHFECYASWLTSEVQQAQASLDPEVLQLPGGTFIAAGLWLYGTGARALRRHTHKPDEMSNL